MSTTLERARGQIEAGKYKAARDTLWEVEREVRGGDTGGAQGLLDVASDLRERTTGSVRDECDELVGRARKALDQGIRAVSLGLAEYLGGSDGWRPDSAKAGLAFTLQRVLFGNRDVAVMSDVASIEVVGGQQARSKVAEALVFGVFGALAAKDTVDRTEIGIHLKSGDIPYFRLLDTSEMQVRAALGPALREAGVPFFDEATRAAASPMDEIAKAFELFKAGALTEDEFKAAKDRLLG